jgi:hypothetical protein
MTTTPLKIIDKKRKIVLDSLEGVMYNDLHNESGN